LRLETVVTAEPRSSRGKNEARRTRVAGKIPAIVYGAFKDPQAVSVSPKEILRIIRGKGGHNAIFNLDITGIENTPVIVADEQYEPVRGTLMHVDLKRIDLARKLRVSIPVHTTGDAKGIKQQGGVLDVVTRSIEIECIPDDIPLSFDVDVTELMIGNAIRVSDLKVKDGIRVLTAGEAVIAHVVGIKEEAAPAADAAKAGDAPKGAVDAAKDAAKDKMGEMKDKAMDAAKDKMGDAKDKAVEVAKGAAAGAVAGAKDGGGVAGAAAGAKSGAMDAMKK